MSVPIIYVTNVAHSTTFYCAVTQPLGIVYLTATTLPSGASQQHFGITGSPSETLFSLQESSNPRPSTITLTASNGTQVTQFHNLAVSSNSGRGTNLISQSEGGTVAKTTDFDGNLLEVKYERNPNARARPSSNGGGSIRSGHAPRTQCQNSSDSHREGTTITTASTAKEAKRVLKWQRTVARSVSESSDSPDNSPGRTIAIRKPQAETVVSASTLTPQRRTPPPAAPSAPSLISQALHQQQAQQQQQAGLPSLMRAATAPVGAMTAVYNEITSALPSEKFESSGLSTNAIIGTIMGAAAGAAIAYAMVKSEEPESPKPQLVTYFSTPAYQAPQQVSQQQQARRVMQQQQFPVQQPQQPMGHDMGHNILQAMRQHQPPQPVYAEPAHYYSPSGIEVGRSKALSVADSGYSGSKASRSEALKQRSDCGNSQSGSRVVSLRESSYMDQVENYSSSPKSTMSANPSHHSSRSKVEGSHISKSSSRQAAKPESPKAETVASKQSVAKSSASTSRGSETSTVKPARSSASKATSKAPPVVLSEAKTSHTSHSRSTEKSQNIGSITSVKSEKSKHSSGTTNTERARRVPVPHSEVGSIAGTVVPEDSVSQVGSRHSSSRRRQEMY